MSICLCSPPLPPTASTFSLVSMVLKSAKPSLSQFRLLSTTCYICHGLSTSGYLYIFSGTRQNWNSAVYGMQACHTEVVSWWSDTFSAFTLCCLWWQSVRDLSIITGKKLVYGKFRYSYVALGILLEHFLVILYAMLREWHSPWSEFKHISPKRCCCSLCRRSSTSFSHVHNCLALFLVHGIEYQGEEKVNRV